MMDINILLIISFFGCFVLGLIINNFFIKRPIKFLVKKANISAIRWSSQSKPIFGGITFFAVFILLIILSSFLFGEELLFSPEYFPLIMVIMLSFLMGLADDIINTPPSFKFIIQFLCAIILIYNGFYIHISPNEWINYTLTTIWVLGIMNSINMLDNMDSITTLTTISIVGGIILFYLFGNIAISPFLAFLLVGVFASFISFMFYNWNPAKMYMGDNGSQFIGILLAFLGILFFWNSTPIAELDYAYNTKQFIIIALAFVVPISDTTTVTINRLLRKQSPFVGGRDHTTHYLAYLGLSVRWIGVILFSLNTIGVILALNLINSKTIDYSKIWLYALYPIIVFLMLYINTKITKQK